MGNSYDFENTLGSLREEIRSFKEDNDKIMQVQEKKPEVNAILLQSLVELWWQGPLRISHGQDEKNKGAYGSRLPSRNRSYCGQMSERYDMIRDDRLFDTLDRRGVGHMYYSSSGSQRYHDRHHYHPYQRSDRGYFIDDFKKAKPPTFDGEMNKSQDAKAWMLGMRKFFKLHYYSENMKARIALFSLKGKTYIWWEDVKNAKGIDEEDLN